MNQTRSMLQSETEYIDAGPHQPASTKASCTARPDHTLGPKAEKLKAKQWGFSSEKSELFADEPGPPVRGDDVLEI
jgi:hypothetical protein